MLIIRRQQMVEFQKHAMRRYEVRILEHLLRNRPHTMNQQKRSGQGNEAIRDLIRDAVHRAAAHGIEDEYNVCRYVELCLEYGVGFEEGATASTIRRILSEGDLPPTVRLDLAVEQLPDLLVDDTEAPS